MNFIKIADSILLDYYNDFSIIAERIVAVQECDPPMTRQAATDGDSSNSAGYQKQLVKN
jgi:hypothetical protein